MAATEAVLWASLAALNLALALLVGGAEPRRRVNVLAAVLFAGNGLGAVVLSAGEAGSLATTTPWVFLLNLVTLVPLAALPFVFPRRRLTGRAERGLLAAVALLLLPSAMLALVGPTLDRASFQALTFGPVGVGTEAFFALVFFGAPAVGTLLLLDAYLEASSRGARDQARFLLAAYGMKTAFTLGALATVAPSAPLGQDVFVDTVRYGLAGVVGAALGVALIAVPLGLVAARLRGRQGALGEHAAATAATRPWGDDAFVVGFLVLGLAVPLGGLPWELEYLLARPILLGYAVLQYQVLNVDLHRRRAPVALAILAAMVGTVVLASRVLGGFGLEPGLAAALALLATLGLGGMLAWPVLRVVVPADAPAHEPRGRDLYLAALEQAVRDDPSGSSEQRVLRTLRARLGISEREHHLLEATLRGPPAAPADLGVGRRFLGRYRVEQVLGQGGFGRTYLAHDEQLDRRVVLKVARAEGPEEARRLLREARIVGGLQHPAVVTVHDVEVVGDACIMVMEHVDGGSLQARLREGPLSVAEALALARDVLAGLEAAHGEGIVHRDLKPANILLDRAGRAKVADFGVAHRLEGSGTASGFSLRGANPGSLRYMSPEQVRGKPLDARSDLYSFAVVLYEALAGKAYLPLEGRTDFEVRLAILEEAPALPLRGVPAKVNAVLAQCLAKEPAERPADAAAVRRALGATGTRLRRDLLIRK